MKYQKCQTQKKYIRDGRAPIPEKESTSKVMSANKGKNTKIEVVFRKLLFHNGFRGYRIHWKNAPGRPDIVFPGKKMAIFIHGCFWHRCPICNLPLPKTNTEFWKTKFSMNQDRDARKIEQLNDLGWKTVVIWECEIKRNIENCLNRVQESYFM